MEYNILKIGKRIRQQRKEKLNITMEELASAVGGITRQTVSKWEKGEGEITVNDLIKLCKIFNCDMGFLLCEYDVCKTRDLQYIHDVTGLSEAAIHMLSFYKHTPSMEHIVDLLDDLILDRGADGINTLSQIASIAYAIMATRADIPASELQANMNYAGLNWNCQQMFMQFIDRYTKI